HHLDLHSFPTRRSSDLSQARQEVGQLRQQAHSVHPSAFQPQPAAQTGFQAQAPQPVTAQYQQPAGFQQPSRQQSSSTQQWVQRQDRKSTRLNSSHVKIS